MRPVLLALLGLALTASSAAAQADTTPPNIDFGGPAGPQIRGTVTFNPMPSDNTAVVRVEYSVQGAALPFAVDNTPGDGFGIEFDTTTFTDGPYTFVQTAYDAASNSASDSRSLTIDNTLAPPVYVAPSPADNTTTTANSLQYTFTKDADVVTTTCRINLGTASACTSPHTVDTSAFADGAYTLTVSVTDDAGNQAFANRTFKIDRTAPTLTVSAPTGFLNATTITPTTSSEDAGGSTPTLTCKLDAGAFGSCSGIPVSEGAHTLRVRATDTVGNFREVDTSFTVDRTLPEIAVTPRGGGGVVEVEWTATDATPLTFACKLDDGEFATCASGVQFSGLKAGSHSVTVRATDAAGNSRSQTRGFIVNAEGDITTPPTTTPPTTGGSALPTRPKVTAPATLGLAKAKRKLRITVATTVPGCRLRLIKGTRAFVSRKIVKAGTTKLTITLDRRVRPGTYVLTLKCGTRTAKRKLKLTA